VPIVVMREGNPLSMFVEIGDVDTQPADQ